MQLEPRGMDQVRRLVDKGVDIPNPWTLDIGPEVNVERISGNGVTIHPGCRIRGASTVISAGVELGREGPVTIEDVRLGPNVALKGGYAAKATFLQGANLGLGHHVREGTLLEEEASGAHCVGLKQTILFPFVTLGSLINFCDAFMAGGTSRSDHSEIGSSYIHFNFTPSGDKTTPSLFGDVPRGVLLRQRPIFLGGQGGAVGPVEVAYGTVVGAGSVIRRDVLTEDTLTLVGAPPSMNRPFAADDYRNLVRVLAKNVGYLAQLNALEQWYRHVRVHFFATQELGPLVAEGAHEVISAARKERCSRLGKLVAKLPGRDQTQMVVRDRLEDLIEVVRHNETPPDMQVVESFAATAEAGVGYLEAIRGLSDEQVAAVRSWLGAVVAEAWSDAAVIVPELGRYRTQE
ncbi:UDP-N-acetylglucosamine pyrophosphorylase [Gephyromycinifex aptenodytis]|uniref:UDP-N-acetylglucosamine pyrophosphorylase n=1 Tax=Gephyromycinifex aptenodytis TaxID=2716227 RepID=UPI0014471D80|nr:UDP-N-acetylglucosamine pyrophosphorylase [Gephyromycinifex aptenodytis]